MSLPYISQQITIYYGWFLVISGFIGNAMNILVFSSVRTYRTNPCTFYFLMTSIDNNIYIITCLITRILAAGHAIDFTRTLLIWCKIRNYLVMLLPLISFTFSCLASIDQFLVTSPSANIRQLSNIKWAHRIVFIVIIVCILHGIPIFFFVNINPIINVCMVTNADYALYVSIYVLSFTCVIPVVIMMVFGYLTYRNIHSRRILANQRADIQVTRMTFVQIIFIIIAITPYGINNIYGLITSGVVKNSDRLMNESFASTIVTVLTYINYIGSYYMFFLSSRRFRQEIQRRIFFWKKRNEVVPYQERTAGGTTWKSRTRV